MVDASSGAMLRIVARLTLIALAALGGAGARLAHAQPAAAKPAAPAEAPPDPDLNAAKAEFEEGQDFFKKGQYADAVAKFQSAYAKKPYAPFLFNTGAAYEMAGKLDQAVQYYTRYLEKEPNADEAKDVSARIEA